MTKKTKRIMFPLLGVAAAGSIAGAVAYFMIQSKPEQWQTKVDEVRLAHFGLDGAQLISYVEDGAYNDAKTNELNILDWKEKETTKTFWVYSYESKTGVTYTLNKGQSLAALLPGVIGDKYAIGVESTRYNFNSKSDREKFEVDFDANSNLAHQSVYKTGVIVKLDQYQADYTVESVNATGQVRTPALRYDDDISVDEVKGLTKDWTPKLDGVTSRQVTMQIYSIGEDNRPIWNQDHQQFAFETEVADGITIQKRVTIPAGMEGITTGLQLVGHDVRVTDNAGNIYDFGVLERYGNEFVIHDKNKDADGEIKLTVWW